MNDPNGLIQFDGEYHLFYQHNPHDAYWARMHWGHAVSRDLVHWNHLPIALTPSPNGPDATGCFSGCCIIDSDGTPTLLYTGVSDEHYLNQVVCLATNEDGLRSWRKHPEPVLHPPASFLLRGFRDPFVWRNGDEDWHMLIGSGAREQGGILFHYTSHNLRTWSEPNVFFEGDPHTTGTVWECPDFFCLKNSVGRTLQVLIVSPIPLFKSIYFVGDVSNGRFVSTHHHTTDWGSCFYAPQSFTDESGRRIQFGWLREMRPDQDSIASGWAGVMSLPRVMTIGQDDTLRFAPAPELESLRRQSLVLAECDVDEKIRWLDIQGAQLEIEARVDLRVAVAFTIVVLASPDQQEQTRIVFDATSEFLFIDVSQSNRTQPRIDRHHAPLRLMKDEQLHLRVFVDASVIEVFANERVCLSERVYPSRNDSTRIGITSNGHTVVDLSVWKLLEADV
jgi:beta-fructofuranosidase